MQNTITDQPCQRVALTKSCTCAAFHIFVFQTGMVDSQPNAIPITCSILSLTNTYKILSQQNVSKCSLDRRSTNDAFCHIDFSKQDYRSVAPTIFHSENSQHIIIIYCQRGATRIHTIKVSP